MNSSPLSFDFIIDSPEWQHQRVDVFLAEELDLVTRSQLKARLSSLTINGAPSKLSRKLEVGDQVHVDLTPPVETEVLPEPVDLDIIFENDDVVVINKPSGMVVHPANGNYSGTLVQGLMFRYSGLKKEFEEGVRPGIVHRLDKATSGVLMAAKNPAALEFLARQFRKKRVEKTYLAVVKGVPSPSSGTIERPLARDPHNRKKFRVTDSDGKAAVTRYKVLCRLQNAAFCVLYPKTGRTHQLRVHMLSMGTPVLGDPLYSRKSPGSRDVPLMLHAYRLGIILPGERSPRYFRAPLPERFKSLLRSKMD